MYTEVKNGILIFIIARLQILFETLYLISPLWPTSAWLELVFFADVKMVIIEHRTEFLLCIIFAKGKKMIQILHCFKLENTKVFLFWVSTISRLVLIRKRLKFRFVRMFKQCSWSNLLLHMNIENFVPTNVLSMLLDNHSTVWKRLGIIILSTAMPCVFVESILVETMTCIARARLLVHLNQSRMVVLFI